MSCIVEGLRPGVLEAEQRQQVLRHAILALEEAPIVPEAALVAARIRLVPCEELAEQAKTPAVEVEIGSESYPSIVDPVADQIRAVGEQEADAMGPEALAGSQIDVFARGAVDEVVAAVGETRHPAEAARFVLGGELGTELGLAWRRRVLALSTRRLDPEQRAAVQAIRQIWTDREPVDLR